MKKFLIIKMIQLNTGITVLLSTEPWPRLLWKEIMSCIAAEVYHYASWSLLSMFRLADDVCSIREYPSQARTVSVY